MTPYHIEHTNNYLKIGAGIQMSPNASKHLFRWGLEKYLSQALEDPEAYMHRWQDGSVVGHLSTGELHHRFGAPNLMIRRADLHQALYAMAVDSGVQVEFNAIVKDITLDPPSLITESEQISVDLIISADGMSVSNYLHSLAD